MKYQLTFNEYHSNTNNILLEKIDYDKINCIKQQMNKLHKRLIEEKDYNARKRLQMQIKVCELKIMIANIQ